MEIILNPESRVIYPLHLFFAHYSYKYKNAFFHIFFLKMSSLNKNRDTPLLMAKNQLQYYGTNSILNCILMELIFNAYLHAATEYDLNSERCP